MGPDGERDKSFVRAPPPPPLHLAIHLLLLLRSSWHQTEQREGGQVVLLRDSVGGAAGGAPVWALAQAAFDLEGSVGRLSGGGGSFSLIHLVLFVHFPGAQRGPN